MSDRLRLFSQIDPQGIANQLEAWLRDYPRMGVLALVPEGERQRIGEIQSVCRSRRAPLVGAVFPQLLTEAGFHSSGIALLRLDSMPPSVLVELGATGDNSDAGVEAFACSIQTKLQGEADTTLVMFFDALVPNIATILEGLYLRLADRVRYVGVNAGSESFKPIPCLFDGERIVQGGVLALLLPRAARVALEHGYRQPEQMVAATSTAGNRIISIDWRPAFEVYREQVKKHYGEEIDKDNFYRLAVHFPFGIVRIDGEVLVRIPVALEDDGSLFCVGEVPANSILTLLQAPPAYSLDTAQTLATRLQAGGGDELLVFYCAGRRMHLGDAAAQELRALQELTGVAHLAGALSLGEIGSARRGGYPLFHNATIICMPV